MKKSHTDIPPRACISVPPSLVCMMPKYQINQKQDSQTILPFLESCKQKDQFSGSYTESSEILPLSPPFGD